MEISGRNAFVCLRCPGNHQLIELQLFLEIIPSMKPKRFSHIGGFDKYLKPETNIFAPENRHPGKGDCYWKPPYLGAVLVSGSVNERFTWSMGEIYYHPSSQRGMSIHWLPLTMIWLLGHDHIKQNFSTHTHTQTGIYTYMKRGVESWPKRRKTPSNQRTSVCCAIKWLQPASFVS